jgi:hypothetical protein
MIMRNAKARRRTQTERISAIILGRAVYHGAHEDHGEEHEERQALEAKPRTDLTHPAGEGANLRILLSRFVFFVLFVVRMPDLGSRLHAVRVVT